MNEPERSELERLKRQHARLHEELALLAGQLKRLETQLAAPPSAPATTPAPVVPQIEPIAGPTRATARRVEPPSIPTPPIIPPAAAAPVLTPVAARQSEMPRGKSTVPPSTPHPVPSPLPSGPSRAAAAEPKASFEMRLGTYWFVRIGAVMVLTGLVFFGNLAYQKLGPAGKLGLLYLASGLLLGAGAWWQRTTVKESLRNYAQVLLAGGLAAVYFTTYAAHYVENLKVIPSALLDGALLLAWAGFMVWVADRKKSEVLALFAVGLAYYASVITSVGSFTLYSNLVLTIAAVFFLVRNRWAGLSWASLVATYAAYAYWRFFHGGEGWRWATPNEGLWLGASFLWSYWLVFTLAVFLSKHEGIAGERRAAFLTFNNGAMFALFILTMIQVNSGKLWQFCLGYGLVLLALAELSRRFLASEPLAKNTYLTQGLVLVTVGLVSKYLDTPRTLALVLAAESVILFILGTLRKNIFLQTGAYLSGAMAVGWGIDGLERNDPRGIWLGATLGALMALNAFWSHWRMVWADRRELRPVPAYFTLLALTMWIATTWFNTRLHNFPLVLAVEAAALTASVHVLRVREFALLGQGLLVIGHAAWLVRFADGAVKPIWWNPILMIGVTLGLSHWWQRQKVVGGGATLSNTCQTIYALALVALVCVWLEPHNSPSAWIVVTSLLAVGATAYGVATRAWPLAICAQLFLLVSVARLVTQIMAHRPEWYFPLAPIAALALLSFATWQWFALKRESKPQVRDPLLQTAMVYRWVALVMSLWWVSEYVNERQRVWVFALAGVLVFLFAGWRRSREALLFGAAFTLAGLTTLWLTFPGETRVYLPNFLAALALLGEQQIARRLSDRYILPKVVHSAAIVAAGLTLWRLVSDWVLLGAGGFYLTASWSALAFALLGGGVVLREKVYRWVGLGILAAALGRVVVIDVWTLRTIHRVLSFLALGIVLIVLGFIYIKYEERIRAAGRKLLAGEQTDSADP